MSRLQSIWALGMLSFALSAAWGQDTTTPPPSGSEPQQNASQQNPQEPVPAYGQENTPLPITENPPLSGVDMPSLEPHAAPLSYIQPGATFSESADSNVANTVGGSSWASISRGIGSVTLQRLWSNYDLAMDYMGGVGYYDIKGQGLKALQQADIDQKVTWKRGQLSLRDSFSYLPEGNFGGAYGSQGSQGIASLGSTAFGMFWGGSGLGTLGLDPRMTNIALADVSQTLTPKSMVTAAGGYAFTHFYGNDPQIGTSFIGTSQVSAQAGYNRLLSAHTQVAVVYGYQAFDFSVQGTAFHSHVVQGMYGHRISGRMDLMLAAGPQFTFIDTQSAVCSNSTYPLLFCQLLGGTLIPVTIKNTKIGAAGQARLRYKLPRTSLDLWYQRFETGGSGLFAGAQSDIVRLSAERPLSRVWNLFTDLGFARNSRIQPLTEQQITQCQATSPSQTSSANCPANDSGVYTYGFVGGGLHRAFGRNFHAFASYQFNELSFDRSFCLTSGGCNRISNRSVITFGLDWTPRPIRID